MALITAGIGGSHFGSALRDLTETVPPVLFRSEQIYKLRSFEGSPYIITVHGTGFHYNGQGGLNGGTVTAIVVEYQFLAPIQLDVRIEDLNFAAAALSAAMTGGSYEDLISLLGNINFVGNEGSDIAEGSELDDVMAGNGGSDILVGGGGNDHLSGGGGDHDSLYGGDGNDILDGGTATYGDSMRGGSGDDTYYVRNAQDFVIEELDGGNDTIYVLGRELYYGYLSGTIETIIVASNTSVVINLDNPNGGMDTTIFGNDRNSKIYCGDGNNIFYGGTGNDFANGMEGNDHLIGGDGDDQLVSGSGVDILEGGSGNDKLGNFRYSGEAAAGTTYIGGGGDDQYLSAFGVKIIERRDGGIDLVRANGDFVLGHNLENLTLDEGVLGVGNSLVNIINGNKLDNVLKGLGGSDVIYAGAGADRINGGTGQDEMFGGLGDDSYYVDDIADGVFENGDEGVDTVYASVDFALSDGCETLILLDSAVSGTGNLEENLIVGNSQGNILRGADGDDVLNGRGGPDTLMGGDGFDLASYQSSGAGVTADLGSSAANTGTAEGDSYISIEGLVGSAHADVLRGASGGGVLDGGAGNDRLLGRGGNDLILGDDGEDVLEGGGGSDELNGGLGVDVMFGGAGIDYFVFDSGAIRGNESDHIVDFNKFGDKLLLDVRDVNAVEFVVDSSPTGNWSAVIYMTSTDTLYYDINGSMAGGRFVVAIFDNGVNLSVDNILVF